MQRRKFLFGIALSAPVLTSFSFHKSVREIQEPKFEVKGSLLAKVRLAMMSMQRASWEQGVAMQGLMEIGDEETVVLMAYEALIRQLEDGRLGMLYSNDAVNDPASNGPGVLYAYKKTGDEKFRNAADRMHSYLKNKAPRTKEGVLSHVTYGKHVFSDAMFMSPPFLALIGDFEESLKQVEGFRKFLWNNEKKLYHHIWDADKNEFKREAHWGGGNGWSAAGIAQIIELLPKDKESDRQRLIGYTKEVIDGCLVYQRTDGLFNDVVDDPGSFVETNLAQMLAYAIFKGVKSGWLSTDYLQSAYKMRSAATAKIDSFGFVQGACSAPSFDKSGTSTEAQAFYLLMEGAFQKLNA